MAQQPYSIDSAIRDIGNDVNQRIDRYQALPPLKKNRVRAGIGAGLIALGLYIAAGRPAVVFDNTVSIAIWAAVVGFGLLWFLVGIHGARSTRDVMSAFWSIVAIAIFGLLTIGGLRSLSLSDDASFYLEGFFAACLVGSIVRFWLAVRGLPSMNLEQVRSQQAHGRAREATPAEAAAKLGEQAASRPRQFRD